MGIDMLNALASGLVAHYGRAAWMLLAVGFLIASTHRRPVRR